MCVCVCSQTISTGPEKCTWLYYTRIICHTLRSIILFNFFPSPTKKKNKTTYGSYPHKYVLRAHTQHNYTNLHTCVCVCVSLTHLKYSNGLLPTAAAARTRVKHACTGVLFRNNKSTRMCARTACNNAERNKKKNKTHIWSQMTNNIIIDQFKYVAAGGGCSYIFLVYA